MNQRAHANHVDEAAREASLSERIVFTSSEMLVLSGKFAAATAKMESARTSSSLAGVRSAFLDLHEIIDQASFLNVGLQHAIEKETARTVS